MIVFLLFVMHSSVRSRNLNQLQKCSSLQFTAFQIKEKTPLPFGAKMSQLLDLKSICGKWQTLVEVMQTSAWWVLGNIFDMAHYECSRNARYISNLTICQTSWFSLQATLVRIYQPSTAMSNIIYIKFHSLLFLQMTNDLGYAWFQTGSKWTVVSE